jgi:hypothetical protein
MGIHDINLRVEADDKAVEALRERLALDVAETDGVELLAWGSARQSRLFTVHGFDTKAEEPFVETVDAEDEAEIRRRFARRRRRQLVHVEPA